MSTRDEYERRIERERDEARAEAAYWKKAHADDNAALAEQHARRVAEAAVLRAALERITSLDYDDGAEAGAMRQAAERALASDSGRKALDALRLAARALEPFVEVEATQENAACHSGMFIGPDRCARCSKHRRVNAALAALRDAGADHG